MKHKCDELKALIDEHGFEAVCEAGDLSMSTLNAYASRGNLTIGCITDAKLDLIKYRLDDPER